MTEDQPPSRRPGRPEDGDGQLPLPRSELEAIRDVFGERGEIAALAREIAWERTAFGPVRAWSPVLRTVLRLVIDSPQPINIYWGPQLLCLYSDADIPTLGPRYRDAFTRPHRVAFPEARQNDAIFARVLAGETIHEPMMRIPFIRNGRLEDAWFDQSFTPIREADGSVAGIFQVWRERTDEVLTARRLALHNRLAATVSAPTRREAIERGIAALADAPDLPFAVAYLIDPARKQANLVHAVGVAEGGALAPRSLLIDEANWPLREVVAERRPVLLDDLATRFHGQTVGEAATTPERAALYPLTDAADDEVVGVLVLGINPRTPLDEPYRVFLGLTADTIAARASESHARARERERLERLAELDRAKTAFFSDVSHEFRTPLTLLLGPLEEALADPQQGHRPDLDVAHRNALRLQRLVNSLLDFARIEAGRIDAVYEPTDLGSLTADLASVFRSAVERAGLRLRVDCPPLPEPVYVDRDMWEKIVLNLVSNAFKFTFDGEIAVSLRLADDGQVALTVRDTGAGIPEAELPRVFERFHRVRDTRARTFEGSGIGLALVQELVRLHGGSIRVASSVEDGRGGEEHGTTFTVSIPTGSAHLPAERIHATRTLVSTAMGPAPFASEALRWLPGAPPAAEPLHAGQDDGARNLGVFGEDRAARVLVADDNADMRDYFARLLARHWTVEVVADGQTALSWARQHPPDLVLADVMMPGLDGFGLLRELRANPDLMKTPVVLVSARAGEESRVEGMRAGADDYLIKPFSARELVTRVGAHLALARQRRHVEETLRKSEERQAFLLKLSDTLRPLAEAKAIKDAATRLLVDHLAVSQSSYSETDGDIGVVHNESVNDPTASIAGRYRLSDFAAGMAILRAGRDLVIPDVLAFVAFPAEERARWAALNIRANISLPLIKEGKLIATLSVRQTTPRAWAEEEVTLVRETAERTWAAVERARAEAAIRESEGELRAAVEERDALLKELHHRVKNNLQVITSLLEMQARTTSDRQELSSLSEARNRISAIAEIHELLYQSGSLSQVDLAAYARRIVRHVVSLYAERSRIDTSVAGDAITVDLARAVPFGLLLNELVSNACKHAFPPGAGGALSVRLQQDDAHLRLQVEDDGVGLPAGLTERPPSTLGLQLVRMLAKQLGATVRFDSPGGTAVDVRIPLELRGTRARA
jgi:signal transduction histidine kinase/DNA-binding response OmpR family regulator